MLLNSKRYLVALLKRTFTLNTVPMPNKRTFIPNTRTTWNSGEQQVILLLRATGEMIEMNTLSVQLVLERLVREALPHLKKERIISTKGEGTKP